MQQHRTEVKFSDNCVRTCYFLAGAFTGVAMDETKTRRPLDTPFRQQTLKAWRPILTPTAVIITFAIVGVVFIPIGIMILSESEGVKEYTNSRAPHPPASNLRLSLAETPLPPAPGPRLTAATLARLWRFADGNYGDLCSTMVDGVRVEQNPCTINITVEEEMKAPVYMYYKLSDFYQNHRRYVKSRMDTQLRGVTDQTPSLLEADCQSHYRYNESLEGDEADSINNTISPCGLIAWSLFNDSFTLKGPDGAAVTQTSEGIAWPSDVSDKFSNADDGSSGLNFPPFAWAKHAECSVLPAGSKRTSCESYEAQYANNEIALRMGLCFPGSGYCMEDEHFMVWMRTAGLPTFRKLYAIIDQDLSPGTYSIEVSNGMYLADATACEPDAACYYNYYYSQPQTFLFPTHPFGGEKHVVLSTVSWMGGKNPFLGYAYVVVGAICIALALLFLIKNRLSPRRLGDPSYITNVKKEGDK